MISWLYRLADAARRRARERRWPADQAAGRRGEDLAHRFLRRRGVTVVARNYRARGGGEIDLIGWDGDALAFIEVKSRATAEFGPPERNVDRDKQRRLERAAREYALHAGVAWERVRFDFVTVLAASPPHLEWIKDAFRGERKL